MSLQSRFYEIPESVRALGLHDPLIAQLIDCHIHSEDQTVEELLRILVCALAAQKKNLTNEIIDFRQRYGGPFAYAPRI